MLVAIAGAHGKIAPRLIPRLVGRSDRVVGLICNPDQAADLEGIGAEADVCDLDGEIVAVRAERDRAALLLLPPTPARRRDPHDQRPILAAPRP